MKDADKGAEIIKEKIETGKKIRIISDYDVDGVSSNYILYQGLKRCGADVDYKIPDRVEDGYGINEHLIEKAGQRTELIRLSPVTMELRQQNRLLMEIL